jgi:integrase
LGAEIQILKRDAPMPLNDRKCKESLSNGKIQKLADGAGLYLEISPSGSKKYWRLKYRYATKEKRLALGVYPQVTLAEARKKREDARKLLEEGIDPSLEKKIQKQKIFEKSENSFESIAREWHAKQEKKLTPDYWKNKLHRLEQDVFPKIGNFPIADLKSQQVLKAIQAIEERGAGEIARRSLQMCGQIFRYAIATSRCENDPTSALKGALEPTQKGHYASFEIDELSEFVKALECNTARLFIPTIHAIKLLMLTFVRTSELIEATWDEFNFTDKIWVIPASRMKMKRQHIIPLSLQTLEILQEQKRFAVDLEKGFIFPSQNKPLLNCMSNNTVLKALARMGYKGKMTGHGFRALAMGGIKEKLGWRHEVVDRQLAHAPKDKITAAYDRAKFLDDRTIMMQQWADYIDGLKRRK